MKILVATLGRAALVLALLLGGLVAPADAACLSQREADQAVMSGQAVPFNVAPRQAGLRRRDVVGVQLCDGGRGYVYRVEVYDGRNRTSTDIPAD